MSKTLENIGPGERLGAYEIVRVISRGGMGIVFEALDTGLSRKVAIKVLAQHLVNDAEMLSRFQREAKALASLSHPNIVGIHTLASEDDLQYLVLEYVEGETVGSLLKDGPVPLERAIEWMRLLTDALKSAHELSIIHRDIKPSNVLIRRRGNVPKLSDFGLAKGEGIGTSLTTVGSIIGTLEYIAPEIFDGRGATAQSDIYSLGLLFYEILSGRCPYRDPNFTGGNYFQMLAVKKREPAVRLRKIAPSIPRPIEKIVMKMCRVDPDERYRDLAEVARDLARDLSDTAPAAPAPAPSPAAPTRLIPTSERQLVLDEPRRESPAALSLDKVAPPASRRAPAPAKVTTLYEPETSSGWRRMIPAFVVVVAIVGGIAWLATRNRGPATPVRTVASTAYPPGTYVVWSAANRLPTQLADAGATGVTLQIVWSDIESRDDYRWNDLDRRLEEAKAQGLKVAFALVTSLVHAPDSVRTKTDIARVSILHRSCRMVDVPVFWDPTYHTRKKLFIAELGRRYAADEALVAVSVSFANFDSETWHLPTESEAVNKARCGNAFDNARPWLAKGLSEEKTLAIATDVLDVTAAAFPAQALKLAVAAPLDLLRSRQTVSQLIETANVKYPGRLYLQINTLDTASPPASNAGRDPLYALLIAEAPHVGFQLRADASTGATDGCVQNGGRSPCPAEETLRRSLAVGLGYRPTFIEIAPGDAVRSELTLVLLEAAKQLKAK